jgi:hypothetical protein
MPFLSNASRLNFCGKSLFISRLFCVTLKHVMDLRRDYLIKLDVYESESFSP